MDRPQKITLGEMRASGVRGLLIYCADARDQNHRRTLSCIRSRCSRCTYNFVRILKTLWTTPAMAAKGNRAALGIGDIVGSVGSVGGRPSEAVYLGGRPWNGLAGKHR
jgi:hypothetical protein